MERKEKSRRNKNIVCLVLILLMLTLVTSCIVGKSFAKYATGEKITGKARVANFGITFEVGEGTIFANKYRGLNDDEQYIVYVESEDNKLVAPGTSGKVPSMTISGNPEVAVKIEYDIILELQGWKLDSGSFYCPIIFTIGETQIKGTSYESSDQLQNALKEAIKKCQKEYQPNTALNTHESPTITWEWPFEGDDAKDTELGKKALNNTINLTIATNVTQINQYQKA